MDDIKKITPDSGKEAPSTESKVEASEQVSRPVGKMGFYNFPQKGKRFFSPPFINRFRFGGKKLGIVVAVLIILLLFFGVIPGILTYGAVRAVSSSGQELYSATQNQDLDQMKVGLQDVKKDLNSLKGRLVWLGWVQVVPFVGGYWKDANAAAKAGLAGVEAGEIVVETIGPYADILGFDGGEQATDGAKTAEDRINFIAQTIGDIVPQLGAIGEKTSIMAEEINKIDPYRYPEHFRGKMLRESIKQGITFINQAHDLVTNGKPVLEQAPYLLGIDGERKYLFLWQNDKEIRPTGGFLTAYSIVSVKDGKIQPVTSNDIYNLDNQFNSRLPAPDPIKKYLPLVHYWNLRDMNLSPDFKVSMDTFSEYYGETSAPEFDGIIAVDTQPLVDLLEVVGTIGVPGFGNFSAEEDGRCNCPQVIYELESFADVAGPIIWADDLGGKIIFKPPHADNRKLILGPLMNSILANAMGQPKEKLPDLFGAGWDAVREKHVLFYFGEGEVQSAMESFGIAGRIVEFDGDYLHINDSNFAGAKSNLYVEQEVDLKVKRDKDSTTNTLTIRYKNPQKHDGWLNGPFRDWIRIYVPEGSELIDSSGSEVEVSTSEDLGKTAFEGFFMLRPEGVIELVFQYKTPIAKNGDYSLLIQKQPGTKGSFYKVEVDGHEEEFQLLQDKELRF